MDQIRTLIEPIKKKWVYHFIVSPKTNIIEKPEWYLNQTLKWIHENIDTIESKVKTLDSKDAKCSHPKHIFILCMIELAMMRLTKDMKKVSNSVNEDPHDEAILIHTYNEVIQFTKVVKQLLGDCYRDIDDQHDPLSVFCNQRLFEKIIEVEWQYAEKNLRDITKSAIKWDPVLEGEYIDNYKIPRCVDRLLMLIKSITDRVDCFQQPDCRFKLIEMQCFLFNKFLAFLKRSTETSPVKSNILSGILFFNEESTIDLTRILRILNGVNFLRFVLIGSYFIPKNVTDNLDTTLLDKSNKLAQDYKAFYHRLIEKVVAIYEYAVECDMKKFLNFIEPKLSPSIFEMIRDEVSKVHQERHTQNLLGGLSSG